MLDPKHSSQEIVYRYLIYRDGFCIRKEWDGVKRQLALNPAYHRLILADGGETVRPILFATAQPFTKTEAAYLTGTEATYERAILLKVRCPRLRKGDWRLAISGNQRR